MTVKQHTLIGGVAALALTPILGLAAIPFWLGSILIDIDHYLEFIYHNRLTDFNIKRMHDYHSTLGRWFSRPEFLNLSIFHTVEFLALLYISGMWLDSLLIKATVGGMLFHILLDTIYLYSRGSLSKRAHSIIEFVIRKELMKLRGFHPCIVCSEALQLIYEKSSEK